MQTDTRLEQLKIWLSSELHINNYTIETASADASFRRYFRITTNTHSQIIMDAPPDKEDCKPFVHIATLIETANVQAPHIFNWNKEMGFMLLSDLGSEPYLNHLSDSTAEDLYIDAIDAIIKMQSIKNSIPAYDNQLLHFEMSLFEDWYLNKHLNIQLDKQQKTTLNTMLDLLASNALQQPQVFVHRDYHSRNLMLTEKSNPGVIDFQDAVLGAITYDLVSLLKDCYIAWPRNRVIKWLNYFRINNPLTNPIDENIFIRWFDLMGLQRHLKVLGIFCRLNYRDNKANYLNDLPLTLAYVMDTCQRYDELTPLHDLILSLNITPDQTIMDKLQ
ncbi:MAG: phosphotransferase [Gammaproteobacteria bacterium]|nr:phosphotransferase [Gammaproteobacteria bacterium]